LLLLWRNVGLQGTFEIDAEDGFQVGGINGSKGSSAQENLVQGISSLSKVEEKKLHQP
jgi:hypothetical protein